MIVDDFAAIAAAARLVRQRRQCAAVGKCHGPSPCCGVLWAGRSPPPDPLAETRARIAQLFGSPFYDR